MYKINIFGIAVPSAILFFIIVRFFQRNDVDDFVGKIIGRDRLNKFLTKADLLFGFKKRNLDGTVSEKTPFWVKFLIYILYAALIILGVGSILGILYFLLFQK